MVRAFNQSELGKYFECIIREIIIYSKYFPDSDMAKSTRIIHHNQLLMTKFGRILCLTRK